MIFIAVRMTITSSKEKRQPAKGLPKFICRKGLRLSSDTRSLERKLIQEFNDDLGIFLK